MTAIAQATSADGLVIDRNENVIRMVRTFAAASRSKIFAAWTQPEHMACWWDPVGERLTTCEIDLKPGGAFRFVTRSHPEMPFAGTYVTIAPPDTLVFQANGAIGRVVLAEAEGVTRMTVSIECGSSEQLEMFLKMGVDAGTSTTLDNLVAYLGGA